MDEDEQNAVPDDDYMNNFGGAGMGDDGGFGGIDFSKLGAGAGEGGEGGEGGMPGMEGLDAEGGADDSVSLRASFPQITAAQSLTGS